MKHYETEIVPEKEVKSLSRTTCDFCGKDIKEKMHEVNEVEISFRKGVRYPEQYSVTELSVDMCGPCFEGKFISWASEQGVEIREEDVGY